MSVNKDMVKKEIVDFAVALYYIILKYFFQLGKATVHQQKSEFEVSEVFGVSLVDAWNEYGLDYHNPRLFNCSLMGNHLFW